MKKSIIASIVALGMASGMAQAATNEVQFHGNVTTVTCDLTPSIDGSLNPNGPGMIELGDVKVGGEGKVVHFAFKPASDTSNATACNAIATLMVLPRLIHMLKSSRLTANLRRLLLLKQAASRTPLHLLYCSRALRA